MPYRDDAQALHDRVELLENELSHALEALGRAHAALQCLVADLGGLGHEAEGIPWRSVHGGEPIRVRFANHGDRKVELRWVSFDGRERLETTLIPGGEREINTTVAHLWRMVDAESGEVLLQRYARADDDIVLEP